MTVLAADPSAALKVPAGAPVADLVKAQLAGDYPPGALGWVDGLTWTPEPVRVPMDQIDRNTGDWSAAEDKRKVAAFARRISAGWRKPVVAVRRPGTRLLYLVDGHSRAAACAQIGQPLTAWIGTAKTAHGGWEVAHSRQLANDGSAVELGAAGYPAGVVKPASGMISLDLPPGTVKPVPGGVTDHHVTICFLGDNVGDAAFAKACARARAAAAATGGPLTGTVAGVDSFPPSDSSDGKRPAFAPVTIPGAKALAAKLKDLSASKYPFKPHMTLAYVGEGDPLPPPVPSTPVTFTHLSVHRGKDVKRFPLGGSRGARMANRSTAIELVGPRGYIHGWIKVGAGAADHHIGQARKADAEGRHADAINHLTAAIGHTGDKKAAKHLTELRSEMAARAMGKPYKPKAAKKVAASQGYAPMTTKQAEKWGSDNWPSTSPPLPRDQYDALRAYTGPSYMAINHYLRTGTWVNKLDLSEADLKRYVGLLDKATRGHPTPSKALVVHRGVGLDALGSKQPDKLVGKTVREHGFLSTSAGGGLSEVYEEDEAHLEIRVPAGTPAFYMEGLTTHADERELLLGRGLSYKIISAHRNASGQWQIQAEIVPSAAKLANESGAIELTAQTATASTVPAPIGRPGGPGLWHHKGWQLPPYIQHVRNAMMKKGVPESRATEMAVGIVTNWKNGHDGHGNPVSPQVQAAAARNIAQWEAMKAATHAHASDAPAVELAFNSALHPRVGAGFATGGQFAPKAGAQQSPAAQKAGPKAGAGKHLSHSQRAARAHQLRAQADKYREHAAGLRLQIRQINAQIHALLTRRVAARKAAARAAAAAASGKKGARKVAARSSTKTHRHKTAHRKGPSVNQLRLKVYTLRDQARKLDAEARKLDAQAAKL